MLLRRVAQHIKDQNWTAVGLDLFVVVFGVFLGFQITEWNAARHERAVEYTYLERLIADMEQSITDQQAALDYGLDGVATMDYTAEAFKTKTVVQASKSRMLRGLDATGEVMIAQTKMTTINELVSSGRLALISDLEVRDAINRVIESYADSSLTARQHQDAVTAGNQGVANWIYFAPPEPGSTGGGNIDSRLRYEIIPDWDKAQSDPTIPNSISLLAAWSRYNLGHQSSHLEVVTAFRGLLRQKLAG